MDCIERLRIAWQREFGHDLPADFLARLECQKSTSENASGEVLNKLTSASEECKSLILDLRTKLREEEFFYECVNKEISTHRGRGSSISSTQDIEEGLMYAKVNKPPGISKQTESLEQNDKHLSEDDKTLTSNCQFDREYEEINVSSNSEQSNMDTSKHLIVQRESLSGQKKLNVRGSVKDKIKIFEISESSSSDENCDVEDDYEQLVVNSPPPKVSHNNNSNVSSVSTAFRRQQHNSYEEIALPFLSQPGSNKNQSEIGSVLSQQKINKINTPLITSQVENNTKQDGNQSSKQTLGQSGKTPPPIPARNYKDKEEFEIDFSKEDIPFPIFSNNGPKLSASLKNQTSPLSDSGTFSNINKGKVGSLSTKLKDSEADGEYCSLSDIASIRADTGKHITLVKVKSNGSDKGDTGVKKQPLGERRSFKVLSVKRSKELSKSTDDLSSMKHDTSHSSAPKEAKSIDDLCTSEFYDDVYIPDESDASDRDMKKLFGHKLSKNVQSKKESGEIIVGEKYISLSSSSSDVEDDLMKTVAIEISKDEKNTNLNNKSEEEEPKCSTIKQRRKEHVPDYEQWNFQTLLTQTGISVADNENLNDTASDDENVYDNVENKQETASGHSDDSGVSDATTPEEIRAAERLRVNSIGGSPDLRKSNLSSRISTTSFTAVDGDAVFLQRSGSIDSRLRATPETHATSDEDTISVCSLDDQLDKPDGDELAADKMIYRSEQLRMRHLVAKGILESEKSYLHVVNQLVKAKHYLQSVAMGPNSQMAVEDVTTIFYKLDDIYQVHKEFVDDLERKVKSWSDDQNIGDTFKTLVVYFKVYEEYVKNYQTAVETIHKYQENDETKHLFEKMFKSRGRSNSIASIDEQMEAFKDEGSKLEDILLKPVQRIQTNSLVLHDLIKHTPEDHPDYKILQKALKLSEENLKTYNSNTVSSCDSPDSRHLVRSGFVVEVSRDKKNNRHLRYVFLFNDIIICTKHKGSSKPKEGAFKFVWCFPMSQLRIHVKGEKKYALKESLDELKYKIGNLKIELREEMLKVDGLIEKAFSIAQRKATRNVEKLKKKIQEQEATLVEALPRLPLHLEAEGCRPHTFLFATDYERQEWREAMDTQIHKYQNADIPAFQPSNHECEQLIASTKLHTQVNGIGIVLLKKDEEMLTGSLNVTIHKLQGLDIPCEVYCCLEMDSYGHFYKKAQTRVSKYISDAAWDQDFELELDGSQTLRILCYRKRPDTEDDIIVGKCALELSLSWLNSKFNEKTITMNEVSITVSIRHTHASKTLRRTQSKLKTGIFGIKIENVTKRESKTVPSIVTTCVQQVEARGLEEVGIYRVSGVTSDIQHMKKLFDKNPIAASAEAEVADIHALTGVLKLYFRELPEPLFTEANYPSFIKSIELQNEGAKEKCMLEVLHSLPEANYYTIVYMIEHLVRVSKQSLENKMSISNLSTIFGPTLLTPAVKEGSADPMVQMARAAKDATLQSEVVNFFLKLAASGKNIRKSAVSD